jgi:zinc protease
MGGGTRLAVLFWLLAAPALAVDPATLTRVTELANGLTVLTLEDHTTPVVSFQIWVKVGSGDEARYTGLAHLFEHMMFRGTQRLGPEDHERIIEARGGRINAFTSRDVTVYFDDLTAEHLPVVIDLEAERFAHLDIGEASLDSEREVVLEERRLRTEDSPQGRAYEALFALAYQAHPYRHPTIGWRSDVEAATVPVCREFFDAYYAPNNLVISVAGDIDEEEVLERIRKSFGRLAAADEIPRNPTLEPEQRGERRDTVYFDLRAPILTVAWHAPAAGHADADALDVASEVLSSGRSSRLYRRLVYDEQEALSAEAAYYEMRRSGLFFGFVGVRPDASIERAEALLFDEIRRLRDEPVGEAELAKAKRGLEVALLAGLETSHAVASSVARDFVTLGRIRPLEERLEALRSVTAADVQRVAQTYLLDEKRNVVRVVSPPEDPS